MPSQWLKQWFPHLPNALDRAPMAGLMCAAALLLGVALAGARTTNPHETGMPPDEIAAKDAAAGKESSAEIARLREEEELVDQAGQIRMNGEKVVFLTADGRRQFVALENQLLETVAKTVEGNPVPQSWVVSGKVTEYRGANYLLLTRAQYKSQVSPTEAKP